jgi:hypothetical protein
MHIQEDAHRFRATLYAPCAATLELKKKKRKKMNAIRHSLSRAADAQ